jgi:prepilin-type N-terminal cleavage/methylation domain-containing protein
VWLPQTRFEPQPQRLTAAVGFTLIELMIALTLGVIVLSAVHAAFSTAMDSQRRGSRVATELQAWRYFSMRLQRDLKNLIVTDKQSLNGDEETLRLRSEVPENGADWVQYRYIQTPSGGQIRRAVGAAGQAETVVYDTVEGLRLRYLQGTEWRDHNEGQLPGALACIVKVSGRTKELLIALEVDKRRE